MTVRHERCRLSPSPAASVASRIARPPARERVRAPFDRSWRDTPAVQDDDRTSGGPGDVGDWGERVPVFGKDDSPARRSGSADERAPTALFPGRKRPVRPPPGMSARRRSSALSRRPIAGCHPGASSAASISPAHRAAAAVAGRRPRSGFIAASRRATVSPKSVRARAARACAARPAPATPRGSASATLGAHGPAEIGEQRVHPPFDRRSA